MSYILDALRKSETERRQGKVPDLGQQVQLVHRPKKRRSSAALWITLALLVNAGVLAVVFWPEPEQKTPEIPQAAQSPSATELDETVSETVPENAATANRPPESEVQLPVEPVAKAARERPMVITPSARQERKMPVAPKKEAGSRVPHLVELPVSFQKSIPDLVFNSHIYSTDPYASRVMINGHYLRAGESFEGITVEEVTEDGVVLSKQGKTFRVGIVRDWVSPR